MFLSDDQLEVLTGYRRAKEQLAWLQASMPRIAAQSGCFPGVSR